MTYWICQGVGWGSYTFIKILAAVFAAHVPWVASTAITALQSIAGLALTHVLRGYMQRHHWHAPGSSRLIGRSAAASFLLALPLAAVTVFTPVSVLQDTGWTAAESTATFGINLIPAVTFLLHWINWAAIFAIWLAIYFATQAVRQHHRTALRQSETARALQHAELRLLKSQLNPHFLFNALNTVRSLIAEDTAKAQQAVTRLANTLRYTLRAGQHELVSFASELEMVNDFLELERMRFEERLTVERSIGENTGSVQVPALLLQTVVENAIKHGVAELPAGGTVRIAAELRDGELRLDIENPCPLGASRPAGLGTGLHNAEERLRLLFGSRASLVLDLATPGKAFTHIRIPQRA